MESKQVEREKERVRVNLQSNLFRVQPFSDVCMFYSADDCVVLQFVQDTTRSSFDNYERKRENKRPNNGHDN